MGDIDGDGALTTRDIHAMADILAGKTDPYGGHQYVDMGLPSGTLWATVNLGAQQPHEAGDYLAWGEVQGNKYTYDWTSYAHCQGNDHSFITYCTDRRYGTVDGHSVLAPQDDAATQQWGRGWRMPTFEEQDELLRRCNTQWRTQEGIPGLWCQGPNYRSIFLPAAGYWYNDVPYEQGEVCSYWGNELSRGGDNTIAYCLTAYSDYRSWTVRKRCSGRTVRAVAIPYLSYCDMDGSGSLSIADLTLLIRLVVAQSDSASDLPGSGGWWD